METSNVSVIIPCYNYGQYLEQAIDSVIKQSIRPHEIIIVDDGSTDNSWEIICGLVEKYKSRFNIGGIKTKNGGLSSARNAGIKMATGKYIMSFDSDDIMRPDCIKEHLKLADENSIVTCGLMAFGNENYTAYPRKAKIELLLKTNVIYSNSLFPKKMWESVGGFDESEIMRKGLEDWEMWIRMAEAGAEFKVSKYIGLLWRRHPNTMSSTMANPNWNKITSYMQEKHKNLYIKYNLQ